MPTITGRNVKVEVALTLGTPVAPTAVSKAYPPVATLNAHGIADNTVGYWTVSAGMVELNDQACVVDNPLTNTFELPGLDSTNYSTYTAGTFTPAATWGTVSEAASYNVGGGAAEQLDDTRLMDVKTRNVAGNLGSQDVSISVKAQDVSGAAMRFIERAAMNGSPCLFRITKNGQVLRAFWGTPSLPGESVSAGAIASGEFNVVVPAFTLKPNV